MPKPESRSAKQVLDMIHKNCGSVSARELLEAAAWMFIEAKINIETMASAARSSYAATALEYLEEQDRS